MLVSKAKRGLDFLNYYEIRLHSSKKVSTKKDNDPLDLTMLNNFGLEGVDFFGDYINHIQRFTIRILLVHFLVQIHQMINERILTLELFFFNSERSKMDQVFRSISALYTLCPDLTIRWEFVYYSKIGLIESIKRPTIGRRK